MLCFANGAQFWIGKKERTKKRKEEREEKRGEGKEKRTERREQRREERRKEKGRGVGDVEKRRTNRPSPSFEKA